MESNSNEPRSTRKSKRRREPTTNSRRPASGEPSLSVAQKPRASSKGNGGLGFAKRQRRSAENSAAGIQLPRLTDDLVSHIATFTEERDRLCIYAAVGPRSPQLRRNLAGLILHARAKTNSFFGPYYKQDPEVVLSEETFAALAEKFPEQFIRYAVNPKKTPACCITPDTFQTFLQRDSRRPGAYKSAVFVRYNSLKAVLDGRIEFPNDVDQKYRDDIFTVIRETLKIVDEHCAELGIDPTVANPFVAILYAGLTVFNVAWNPEAEDDTNLRKGRIQQHIAGGFSKSLNSALIAFITKGKRFGVGEFKHCYGLAATCEFGDVPTAAGLELFGAVGLVGKGRDWTSSYGETTNKACVGLISSMRDSRDSKLWADVCELRDHLGHDTLLTDEGVPSRLVNIARHSVLRTYIVQTHALERDADPAAISLSQLSSAISAHASAVSHGIGMDEERAAALISTIPREVLLDSFCRATPSKLNRLIREYKVECGTFGLPGSPHGRVKKIILEHFEVDLLEYLERNRLEKERAKAEREQRNRLEKERAKAEREAQLRKLRMEHLARVSTYSVTFKCSLPFGMMISPRENEDGTHKTLGACVSSVKEGGQAQDLCVMERSVITRVERNSVHHLPRGEIIKLIQTKQKENKMLTIHFEKSV